MADWQSVIPDFRAKVAQFLEYVSRIEASTPANAALAATKVRLLSSAKVIRATIENVTKAIDKVANTLGLGALGFVQFIPVAAVLSAIAAITYFVSEAVKYLNANDEANRIRAQAAYNAQQQGATPQQVQAILQPEVVSTASRLKANWIPWVLAGGITFLILRIKAKSVS